MNCIIRRGSLLVAIDVVASQGGDGQEAEQQLASIVPAEWLQWLGLPDTMEVSVQVHRVFVCVWGEGVWVGRMARKLTSSW